MALSWHKGLCHISYWNKAVNVTEWKHNEKYKPGDIVYTNAKQYGHGWYQSFTSWSMCMFKHTSNQSNKPKPLQTFSDLIADIVVDIEIILNAYFKGFTKHIASILIDYCYKQNKYWWNGCIAARLLDPHASDSCGHLVSGFNTTHCIQCGLFDISTFTSTVVTDLTKGMWILSNGIPHKIESFVHPSPNAKWGCYDIEGISLYGRHMSVSCGSACSFYAFDVHTLDVEAQNKIIMASQTFNSTIHFGATIKISKSSNAASDSEQKENIVERIHVPNKTDKDDENMEKSVWFDKNILNKAQQKKIAVSNLMKRNFNEDMNDLIDACFGINQQEFEQKMNINLGNNVCIWGLYQNNDLNQNLLCGLVWRRVDVSSSKLKMFEIIFLSTCENVRFQKYGQLMYRKIEIFCRQNCIDIMAVAAVPKHGVGFWKRNGFVQYVTSDGHIVTDKSENNETIGQYLKNNMLVFVDTPLFAKLVNI